MKIQLKNIKPNPFRNIAHYPIQKEKVARLRESIQTTTFWDNIVARQTNGHVEIAYGHHRLAALREEFKPDHVIDLIIRPLDDEKMIQVMARENMEEWITNAWVEMETVKAVVLAFAAGKIKLKKADKYSPPAAIRYAPSFLKGGSTPGVELRAYNAETISEFIGMSRYKVQNALQALELVERDVLKESDFYKLTPGQAEGLVTETASTLKWREDSKVHAPTALPKAREVGKAIAKTLRKSDSGRQREVARKVRDKIDQRPKRKPMLEEFLREVSKELFDFLRPDKELTDKILEILKVIDDVDQGQRNDLHIELMGVSNRAKELASMVKSGKGVTQKKEFARLLLNA
jgi:ParB-like chromosome segregation protein Spo0J